MKKQFRGLVLLGTLLAAMGAQAQTATMKMEHYGDSLTVLKIESSTQYLLLPVQEPNMNGGAGMRFMRPAQVKLYTGNPMDTFLDVSLMTDKTDYYVPLKLNKGKESYVEFKNVPANSKAWDLMKLSDTFDTTNTDYYRPIFHHSPAYGWMNDANGLVYKDGEYHLYFQYNPMGSRWGNMTWGHSVSKDMIHWEHLDPAIWRDSMGHIFSGSSVVDKDNTAGFGAGAIIAFYTSSGRLGQVQCLAYSTDNGRTFTKYDKNPVLTPFDGLKNFRDPKVFWYEPAQKWYMIVSADKEMRFYSSSNLKEWEYLSGWGKGYGVQPNQFECPDFFQLPVNGNEKNKKWVMIVNVNPGCIWGGSGTEYFVGDFDGKEFKCDSEPEVAKWLDWGKDHYATVTFSNTGNRVIAVPWMSNWQYANQTPTLQYRSSNSIPRELKLFTQNGKTYVSADLIPEAAMLKKETETLKKVNTQTVYDVFGGKEGAYQIEMDITPGNGEQAGFTLSNALGEKTLIYLDMKENKLVMDRNQSGKVDFSKDFPLATSAPLELCKGKTHHLNVLVDINSVEIFLDGGRIVMTNLIFPNKPYDKIQFMGAKSKFANVKVSKVGL